MGPYPDRDRRWWARQDRAPTAPPAPPPMRRRGCCAPGFARLPRPPNAVPTGAPGQKLSPCFLQRVTDGVFVCVEVESRACEEDVPGFHCLPVHAFAED